MIGNFEEVKEQKLAQSKTDADKEAMKLAASWYIAMESKALGKKPLEIELFGQPLVAWRDQKDQPVIMNRYCSHMGVSLALGKAVDSCIQCPFHHWRYNHSGQCVFIPDLERIPPTARQATYITSEKYGYIWVWYGSETPLFPLPEFSPAENEMHKYMPLRFALNTKTTVLRVLEGVYDYSHLFALHDLKTSETIKFTLLNNRHPEEQSEPSLKKEAWLGLLMEVRLNRYGGIIADVVAHALGLNFETLTQQVDSWPSGHVITVSMNGQEKLKTLTSATPIAANKTIHHTLLMVKKERKFWLNLPHYLVFGWQSKATITEDLPIWNGTKLDGGGAYVKYDRGVLKFREFYQKWVNKAE